MFKWRSTERKRIFPSSLSPRKVRLSCMRNACVRARSLTSAPAGRTRTARCRETCARFTKIVSVKTRRQRTDWLYQAAVGHWRHATHISSTKQLQWLASGYDAAVGVAETDASKFLAGPGKRTKREAPLFGPDGSLTNVQTSRQVTSMLHPSS